MRPTTAVLRARFMTKTRVCTQTSCAALPVPGKDLTTRSMWAGTGGTVIALTFYVKYIPLSPNLSSRSGILQGTKAPSPFSAFDLPPDPATLSPMPAAEFRPSLAVTLRALRHRNFRIFTIGQSLSLIGTWMQQVAVGWLVYRMTESALLLGVVGFVSQGPGFLIAPFAGELADRYNKRRMVIVTQTVMMVQAL